MKLKYKHLQIIKHALQHYIQRNNAEEKDIVVERNLLEKVEIEVEILKEEYGINNNK